MRMNEISKNNLLVAEEAQILKMDAGGYMVKVWRSGNAGILHSGDNVLTYESENKAARAIARLRPDLKITSI